MREKRDNLWRFIRTSLLLVSAAAALFGCASKNPLIDEDTPVDDDRTVIAAIEADEQKLREEQALKERQEKERILAESHRRAEEQLQAVKKPEERILPAEKTVSGKQPLETVARETTEKVVQPVVPVPVQAETGRAESIVKPVEPERINT